MSCQDKLVVPIAADIPAGSDDLILQINLRLRLDEVAASEAELLSANVRRQPSRKELRRLAQRIYAARRLRDKLLKRSLFGEPAWDMLLALYHLPPLGQMLTVSGLCCCSGVPQTTAHRWQQTLAKEGLIEEGPRASDARMRFVRLTDHGIDLVEHYLTRLFNCEARTAAGVTSKEAQGTSM